MIFGRTITCDVCGHVVSRSSGKRIKITGYSIYYKNYCGEHAPKFDRIVYSGLGAHINHYRDNVPVDSDGIPIGYKKIE